MLKSRRLWVVAVLTLIVVSLALFLNVAHAPESPQPLPLTHTFDKSPTGFSIQYPEEWQYIIPSVGVMIVGPAETLYDGVPGPTLTIQRAEPLAVVGDLDSALDRYLQSGPLRAAGQWRITSAAQTSQLEQRDARTVELESAGDSALHTHIVITSADNTFVYLFVTSVPAKDRAMFDPTFEAMLESVRILE